MLRRPANSSFREHPDRFPRKMVEKPDKAFSFGLQAAHATIDEAEGDIDSEEFMPRQFGLKQLTAAERPTAAPSAQSSVKVCATRDVPPSPKQSSPQPEPLYAP